MKWNDIKMKHGIIISIFIALLVVAIVGTVSADPQATVPGGGGNWTPHMAYHQNMTANDGSTWGHGYMMRGYEQGRGMRGGARTMHGTGGMHTTFMYFGAIIAELLMLVWLIVGILVIVLLLRKLKKDKTP
jgi:hypothetical protein